MKGGEKNIKQQQLIIAGFVLIVASAAGGFFGGMKYQESKSPIGRFGNGNMMRQFQRGNNQGFRPVNGEVLSVDDKSMTVKLADGGSKIVLFSESTTFNKSDAATKANVKAGEKVAAFGTENSDGSITAQSVQLNPTMRFGDSPRGSTGSAQNTVQ